jgi:hypothetical protein
MKKINLAFVVALALFATITVAMVRPSLAVTAYNAVTCATTAACILGTNTDGGPGVQGISASKQGVIGQTKFNSTSTSNGQAGVLGQDISTSGAFDKGVAGKSTRGIGVLAVTSTGPEAVLANASTTIGVFAQMSTSGTGVLGSTPNGLGVEGTALLGAGVFGSGSTGVEAEDNSSMHQDDFLANGLGGNLLRANNSRGIDVLTVFDSGILNSFAITAGSSAVGTGVNSNGSFAGVQGSTFGSGFGVQGNNTATSTSIAVRANSFGGMEFVGNGSNSQDNFTVDDAGNVHAHSFTADLAYHTPSANGAMLTTYSHETRAPTIEDFGEATLAVGHAYVQLDPTFAAALVRGVPYFVYITPLGPTRGSLYVTQRTPSGFYVRENGAGGSTVAFDYRIVGKRYIATAPPLQAMTRWPKIRPVIPTFARHPKVIRTASR